MMRGCSGRTPAARTWSRQALNGEGRSPLRPLPGTGRRRATLGLLAALALCGCRREGRPAHTSWSVMGTFCTVTVRQAEAARLEAFTDDTRRVMQDVNDRLTVYSTESELWAVNQNAGVKPVPVSALTHKALELSLRYSELTGGAFDPTVGSLVKMWGFNAGKAPDQPLDDAVIRPVLQGIGYRRLQLADRTAFLESPRASLDLGGIAKGYAVDLCIERFSESEKAPRGLMVDLGGNIRVLGESRKGHPWRIGVRNPFDLEDVLGVLTLTNGMAVATSGNYERFVTIGGRRYAHIIDPRTGRPVEGMAGVTVIAQTATETDAMSTGLFVMGMERAGDVLRELPGCGALFVPDRQPIEIYVTRTFARQFKPDRRYAAAVRLLDIP